MVSKYVCPNKVNHISDTPAYDRMRCPYCLNPAETPVYVRKPEFKYGKEERK
jgi:hypothetical protein